MRDSLVTFPIPGTKYPTAIIKRKGCLTHSLWKFLFFLGWPQPEAVWQTGIRGETAWQIEGTKAVNSQEAT